MTKATHTSGPWEWTGIFIESDGVQIAQVVLSTEPEGQANARLIAAAPELLTAGAALLKECEAMGWEGDDLSAMRAAIAKATGAT